MQTEILRVLRAEARSWWRHRELRRTGDLDEARRLERKTISRDIGYLRAAINNPNASDRLPPRPRHRRPRKPAKGHTGRPD